MARIETTRPNLVPTLQLLGSILKEPAFDPKEFDELKRQDLAGLEEQKSDPQALAFNSFTRYLSPWPKEDPRYTPTIEESIADYGAATVDDAKRYYVEFYGASDATMAVVGDFDSKQVTDLVGTLFGTWQSPKPFERLANEYRDIPATGITIATPDKANAWFIAGTNVPMRDDDPDYPAFMLANEILGGGFLNSRLAVRIRQKDGVSYGVGSFVNASPLDKAGQFIGYAIYAPENVAKVETGFKEEVERARRDGFTAEEVEKARAGMLQNRQVDRSQDPVALGELSTELYVGRTMAFEADFEKRLLALRPADVTAALRKYVDPAKVTIVKAGRFFESDNAGPAVVQRIDRLMKSSILNLLQLSLTACRTASYPISLPSTSSLPAPLSRCRAGRIRLPCSDLLLQSRESHHLDLLVAHADHGISLESGDVAVRVGELVPRRRTPVRDRTACSGTRGQ